MCESERECERECVYVCMTPLPHLLLPLQWAPTYPSTPEPPAGTAQSASGPQPCEPALSREGGAGFRVQGSTPGAHRPSPSPPSRSTLTTGARRVGGPGSFPGEPYRICWQDPQLSRSPVWPKDHCALPSRSRTFALALSSRSPTMAMTLKRTSFSAYRAMRSCICGTTLSSQSSCRGREEGDYTLDDWLFGDMVGTIRGKEQVRKESELQVARPPAKKIAGRGVDVGGAPAGGEEDNRCRGRCGDA